MSTTEPKKRFYSRIDDDEFVDEINFSVVPRYKTSGLSGDEWRIHVKVELKRKGHLLYERVYHTFQDAVAHLPWLLRTFTEENDIDVNVADGQCMQPGCAEPATVLYRRKKEGCSRCGSLKDAAEGFPQYRCFCNRHSRRGDCGLDDADDSYELVEGSGAQEPQAGDISVSGGANLLFERTSEGDPGATAEELARFMNDVEQQD